MVFQKLLEILKEKDLDIETITKDTTFDQLNMDSLDRVELVMSIEEEFDITMEMNESLKTMQDLVNQVEQLLEQK